MDAEFLIDALRGYEEHPVLAIATFVIAGAFFWFAWWLRGQIARGTSAALKGSIDTLNQRLELSREELTALQQQNTELEKTVAAQAEEIAQLRDQGVAGVKRLTQSNSAIQSLLNGSAISTTKLDQALLDMLKSVKTLTITLRNA
jgi:septal ring factor EnvC (AmiA/AmiB activator)